MQAKRKIILDLGTSPLPPLKSRSYCKLVGKQFQRKASWYVHQQKFAKQHSNIMCWVDSVCPHILHSMSPGQFLFTSCSAEGRQSEYTDHKKKIIFIAIRALHILIIALFTTLGKVISLYKEAVVKFPFFSKAQITVSGSSVSCTSLIENISCCHSSSSYGTKNLLNVRLISLYFFRMS